MRGRDARADPGGRQDGARGGASLLRGGAFKPRSSPYAFQGLGEAGLKILADVRAEVGLPIVTEVIDARDVDLVATYADMLQVGTRNMQNFPLLQAVGAAGKPVMLKRGMSATIEEWLMAAEYIAQRGNLDIVLCERGIRTFEKATRNTLDISAVPVAQRLSHLPVIVDPSHSGGRRDLVLPLSRAAIAVGADGIIIDVHPHPETALCDGPQALIDSDLRELASIATHLSPLVGRTLTPAPALAPARARVTLVSRLGAWRRFLLLSPKTSADEDRVSHFRRQDDGFAGHLRGIGAAADGLVPVRRRRVRGSSRSAQNPGPHEREQQQRRKQPCPRRGGGPADDDLGDRPAGRRVDGHLARRRAA